MILHTRMLCFYYFINPPLKIVSYTKTLSLQNIYCKIYLTTKVMGFGFGFFCLKMLDIGGNVPLNNPLSIVSIKIFLSLENMVTHIWKPHFLFCFSLRQSRWRRRQGKQLNEKCKFFSSKLKYFIINKELNF